MRKSLTVFLAGALGVSIAGQQPAPGAVDFQSQIPTPTFKTGVNAVLMDVRVVDRDGHFVRDLTRDDFQVDEDGQAQAISTFELVDIPIAPAERPRFAGKPVESDVASNEHSEGRIYVLVLDDLGMHPLRSVTVRALAREFVEKHVSSEDRVALVTTSARKDMALEFTDDKHRLLDAIDTFQGGYGPGPEPNLPDRALSELRAVTHWLSTIDGRRKTIVLISAGLNSGLADVPEARASDATAIDFSAPPDWWNDPSDSFLNYRPSIFDTFAKRSQGAFDLRDVIDAAAESNVSFYAIDPMGRPGYPATGVAPVPYLQSVGTDIPGDVPYVRTSKQIALQILAEETGGAALVRSNEFSQAFDQVVTESSSYYLLGYTSSARRDGKFHHISVRSTRAGVHVRTRTGYIAQSDRPAKLGTVPQGWTPQLVDVIQSPVQISGLTLSVGTAAFRGAGRNASVEVIVETPGVASNGQPSSGSLALVVVAADADGHIKASDHGAVSVNLSPETRQAVDAHGVRILSRLALNPGRYAIRVAGVNDGDAAKGSVHSTLDVPDFSKGPLTMSGLALSSAAEQKRPTTGSDTNWAQRFSQPPTATRAFAASDELSVFEEIYRNDKKLGTVTVTMTVRSESDDVVLHESQRLEAGAPTSNQTSDSIRTRIPLRNLQAGNYLLTVEASASANMKASASRQILFSVR